MLRRLCIAILSTAILLIPMVAVAPVDAAVLYQESGVRVSITGAGDLLIIGGGDGVRVEITAGDNAGELGLIIDDVVGGAVDVSVPVARNVRANLGGGDDELRIVGVALPGSLNVAAGPAGSAGDQLVMADTVVPGVVIARFVGAGTIRTTGSVFGGTVLLRGGNGDLSVCDGVCSAGPGSTFEKNLRVQAGRRGSFDLTTAADSVVGSRLTVIGGADGADLTLRGHLGLNPVVRTLRGDDSWIIDQARWSGKLRGIASVGDDHVSLLQPAGSEPLLFNVNLGGGDDSIIIEPGFDPASRANGTSGTDHACDLSGVLLGTFETVEREACP